MRAPVSLCMIVKNEAAQLDSCLSSIREYVAEIIIIDTGSNDETPNIAKKYADVFETYTECNDNNGFIASFAQARQRSLSLATQPWILWIDGDDEVKDAHKLPEIVARYEKERAGNPALVMLPYEYAHDHNGKCTCYHFRERLVTPKESFHWQGPVHEVLLPDAPNTFYTKTEDVTIIHKRDMSRKVTENGRNLRILKAHYEKVGDSDVRQLYYLGLEYGNVGDLDNAIKFHKKYVELSKWDDERCLACLKVAEHYQSTGNYDSAIEWGLKASTVKENWGEPYFNLARSFYFLANSGTDSTRNWQKCIHFSRLGLSQPPTETILFVNPMERNFEIHRFLNFALSKVGDIKGALDSVNTALDSRPDDTSLKLNKKVYQNHVSRSSIFESLNVLVKNESITNEIDSVIRSALDGKLPSDQKHDSNKVIFAEKPRKLNVPNRNNDVFLVERVESTKLKIVFYVGSGPEPWNPMTMKSKGIGGSETAVVEMSTRLAALGHSVSVYSDCPGIEGIFDDVEWLHYSKYKNIICDVLVTSRRPRAVDDEFNVKAKVTFCWVHDVGCGSELNHSRALRIDRFLCLSNWHRDFFLNNHKCVHPSQVLVTRNGIDINRFKTNLNRNPHKAVYSSSPDRGMEVAIRIWPKVREKIPNAELHIFYGFQTWEVSARSMNDQGQLDLINRLKNMIKDHEKHGVVNHGRVDQQTLANHFLSAGVWTYPSFFTETSCITAMEAQAAGLRIVAVPIAALNETVGERGVLVSGYWLDQNFQDKFTEKVIEAMERPESNDRVDLQNYAFEHFGWDSLANEWDQMFLSVIKEVERDVLVPYKSAAV